MSASARAEARRKAILSRGSDRLAKLTTSARGEDAPAYMHDATNVRSTSRTFLGEDSSDMPAPKPFTPSPSPSPQPKRRESTPPRSTHMFEAAGLGHSPVPDPSVWSPEQQQQFMRALMGASALPSDQPPLLSPLGDPNAPIDPNLPPMDNPLAAMLFPQGVGGNNMFAPGSLSMQGKASAAQAKPTSRLQKLMPLIHLLTMWCLLGYFVMWFEPNLYNEVGILGTVGGSSVWSRWARLIRSNPLTETATSAFKVQIVPFFWAFLTIEVMLHSVRIFSRSDSVQPPALLSMALPHLPPPIPSIIINSLKYIQMASMFLDDLAGLVVGIGFMIYFAGLFVN